MKAVAGKGDGGISGRATGTKKDTLDFVFTAIDKFLDPLAFFAVGSKDFTVHKHVLGSLADGNYMRVSHIKVWLCRLS